LYEECRSFYIVYDFYGFNI